MDVVLPILGRQMYDKISKPSDIDKNTEFNLILSIALSLAGTIINNFSDQETRDSIVTIISTTLMNTFHSVMDHTAPARIETKNLKGLN